jgi:hypothetical protein
VRVPDRARDLGYALRTLIDFRHANPKDLPVYDDYLLELACMASDRFSEEECVDLAAAYREHYFGYEKAVRAARAVLGHYYTVRGRCLVELGAKLEDPGVCTGEPSDGVFIIGRRAQIFVSPPRSHLAGPRLAIKAGTVCAVEVGSYGNIRLEDIERMRRLAKKNYIVFAGVHGMLFATGPCELRDLPKLAERAEGFDYERVYEKCSEEWEEERRTRGDRAAARRFRVCLKRAAMELFGSA